MKDPKVRNVFTDSWWYDSDCHGDFLLMWHPQWLSLVFIASFPAACTCSLGVPCPGAGLRMGSRARDWFCMSPRQQQHLQINSIGERPSWVFGTVFSAWPKILLDWLAFARILSFEHVWHNMDAARCFQDSVSKSRWLLALGQVPYRPRHWLGSGPQSHLRRLLSQCQQVWASQASARWNWMIWRYSQASRFGRVPVTKQQITVQTLAARILRLGHSSNSSPQWNDLVCVYFLRLRGIGEYVNLRPQPWHMF